jgi:hypothetical protein
MASLLASIFLIAACLSADLGTRPSPTMTGCSGGPSKLQSPTGVERVAVAWPMGMRGFAPEVTEGIVDWTPGTLAKVLLVQVASAPAFTMQGHRCSDGHPLRFSYRGLPPVSTSADGTRTPIPSVVFETEGEAVVPFDAYESSVPGSHFFLVTCCSRQMATGSSRRVMATRSSAPRSCACERRKHDRDVDPRNERR